MDTYFCAFFELFCRGTAQSLALECQISPAYRSFRVGPRLEMYTAIDSHGMTWNLGRPPRWNMKVFDQRGFCLLRLLTSSVPEVSLM